MSYNRMSKEQLINEIERLRIALDTFPNNADIRNYVKNSEDSSLKFKRAFENSGAGMAIVSPDGKFLQVNSKVSDFLGYTSEELLTKTFADITYPADVDKINAKYEGMLKGDYDSYEIEKRYLSKSGNILWGQMHISLIRNQNNEPEYSIAHLIDISARKKAEQALKESEKKLSNIIDHSHELHYIHDTNHVLKYVSKQCIDYFGYTEEEMKVRWTTFATDNPINYFAMESTKKALTTGKRQPTYLIELKRKNNSTFMAEVNESPLFDEKGNVIGLVGSLRDVTDKLKAETQLKESERKFKALFDSSPDTILLANRKTGIIIDANKAAETLFETSLDNIIGIHQSAIHPNIQQQKATDSFNFKPDTGNVAPAVKIDILTSKNRTKTVEIRGQIIKIKDEEFVLGTFRDITIRIQTEKKLLKYKNELEILVEERTRELQKINKELIEKNSELERYNSLFVGREFRIKELRDKIKGLENRIKEIEHL